MASEFPFLDLDEVRRLAERPVTAGGRYELHAVSGHEPARCLAVMPDWCFNPPIGTFPARLGGVWGVPICRQHAEERRAELEALLRST